MFCLPIFPPGDGPQSPQVIHTVPTHHPTRVTLTRCLVAKPGHLKKAQKIFVVAHCTDNPLFVGVKVIKSSSPSLTGHSRLGATERCSVTPPPLSPSEDHYASPLLPSLRSCSGVSCVWMPLAPAQASLGLNSLWLVLLPLAGQLLVLASLLVVNPDPDATGVVGAGKRKVGQGRSSRPMFLSGYYIRCRYRGSYIARHIHTHLRLPDYSTFLIFFSSERRPYEELVKSTSAPENKDAEVGSSGEASDRVTDSRTLPDGVVEESLSSNGKFMSY
ncbi:hypothetical protein EDB89DRAFT_2243593 [Lactarius sanguifluus]|nr:hypothetical protein EDB89DRAFT_2243593 [Lactarius sanguifluus]